MHLCQTQTAAARGACGRLQPAACRQLTCAPRRSACSTFPPYPTPSLCCLHWRWPAWPQRGPLPCPSLAPCAPAGRCSRLWGHGLHGTGCTSHLLQQALGINPPGTACLWGACLPKKMHSTGVQPCSLLICLWVVPSLPSWPLKQQYALSFNSACKALTQSCLHCLHCCCQDINFVAFRPACKPMLQCKKLCMIIMPSKLQHAATGCRLGASPVPPWAKPQRVDLFVAVRHLMTLRGRLADMCRPPRQESCLKPVAAAQGGGITSNISHEGYSNLNATQQQHEGTAPSSCSIAVQFWRPRHAAADSGRQKRGAHHCC